MAKKEAAAAPKKERRIRSIEEQIADAEAKAKELRERAEKRANKERDAAWEKRTKLVNRRDQAQAEIDKIDAQFPQPGNTEDEDQHLAEEGKA